MAWHDFSDLATVHFNMKADVKARYFLLVDGGTTAGQKAGPTYTELFPSHYSYVPRAPKNFYAQLPAAKRERDYCLAWMPPLLADRLITAKVSSGKNAGRILDVGRNKWYVVAKEWDYLRQGALNGVIGELFDGLPPSDLPAPPP